MNSFILALNLEWIALRAVAGIVLQIALTPVGLLAGTAIVATKDPS